MLSPLYTASLLVISILLIILLSSRYKLNTFFVLLLVAMGVGLAAGFDGETVLKALKTGFGSTLEKIGLLIVLGTVLGILLDKTNATLSLANYILSKTGERYAPAAMSATGFLVGLPIFCDSGFVVLSGLAVSLARRLPNYHVKLAACLATGLYAVHCLVPPHPGITAAAGILGIDVGQAMLAGVLLALPTAIVAYFWIKIVGKNEGEILQSSEEEMAVTPELNLPSAGKSILPIIIPIALIALKSVLLLQSEGFSENVVSIIKFIGDPIVALLMGIVLTFPLFRQLNKNELNQLFDEAISKAGPILIITAAGGAFGEIIKALDLGKAFGDSFAAGGLGLLIPFGLAALFKTAQGSTTVAVISAASILNPMLPALGFDTESGRLLALLAMAAGSMCFSHANDSYFWVIARFANLNTSTTLRVFSTATALMSVVTLALLMMLQAFF